MCTPDCICPASLHDPMFDPSSYSKRTILSLRPSLAADLPLVKCAPPREIPKQRWNTLLSPHAQNNCWVIPVYSCMHSPQCVSAVFSIRLSGKPSTCSVYKLCMKFECVRRLSSNFKRIPTTYENS